MNQNLGKKGIEVSEEEVTELVKWLPKTGALGSDQELINYQGFWCPVRFLKSTINCQRHFIAKDTDVIICSHPKTGTTWLKSLLFSVVNRTKHPINQSPLLKHNPHELVHGLETHVYVDASNYPHPTDHVQLPEPRLLSTHLPYALLPDSIKVSMCKILYVTRNPFDMLVSQYYFYRGILKKRMGDLYQPPPIQDFFEDFCQGKHSFGPYFDQVLEYWKISLEQSEKVLFLKYEDLMSDPILNLKKVAEFIGMRFSTKEETDGLITQIVELCSFENMKKLEVNKSGVIINEELEKKSFFRNGQVGDWTNHFTPLMVEKMNIMVQQKFNGTGLSFTLLPPQH